MTSDFNYRAFLLRKIWNSTEPDVLELRRRFITYQQDNTERYVTSLREHVDAAASKLGKNVTYSSNKYDLVFKI